MKINVGICDNEKLLCDKLKRLIMDIKPNWNISVYNNELDLLKNVDKEYILILDIDMPEMDGIKIAESIRKKNKDIEIIFLSNHYKFIQEAFKVKVFRFLNKPIDKNKLIEALDEAEIEITNNKKVAIHTTQGIKVINIKDIVFLEAYGDGTYIYTQDKVIDSEVSLKWWEEKLCSKDFYKTHRGYMVSLRYVSAVDNTMVRFDCRKERVPVARRQKVKLREAIFEYTGSYATTF